MTRSAPWQVVVDCPTCLTEGARVDLFDSDHASWTHRLPVTSTCQLCGEQADLSEVEIGADPPTPLLTPAIDLSDPDAVRAALLRWAQGEGVSLEAHCRGSFESSVDELIARYTSGQPVESSLGAIAFLFPGMAASGGGPVTPVEESAPPERKRPAAPPPDPEAPSRLLVSVMVADGALRAGERAFVDAFLEREGLTPLGPTDLRPWRPHEIGPIASPALAERSLEAAVELMHLDGQRDGSELRVIRTFARVWGIPESRVDEWNQIYDRRYAPPLSTVWRALTRWFT